MMRWGNVALAFAFTACGGSSKQDSAAPVENRAEPPAPADAPLTPEQEAQRAQQEAAQAVADADAAKARVEALMNEIDAFEARLAAVVDALADAKTDADRKAAAEQLRQLQLEEVELKVRVDRAKAEAEAAERKKGVKITPECQADPLAKGCP